jgi:hypothetical protein
MQCAHRLRSYWRKVCASKKRCEHGAHIVVLMSHFSRLTILNVFVVNPFCVYWRVPLGQVVKEVLPQWSLLSGL